MFKMHQIADIWSDMEAEKGDLIDRSEAYARWTIPSIMPAANTSQVEQEKGSVMIGARLVNHLSNKVIDVLYPVSRPFFTVALTPEATLKMAKEIGEENSSLLQEAVRKSTSTLERVAMRKLRLTEYRPVAITTTKHLIITGNALLRRMPSGKRILYGVNRFGIRRDIEGNEYEIVLHDKKKMSSFDLKMKELIRTAQSKKFVSPQLMDNEDVVLLTHYKKMPDGRWCVEQEADGVPLNNKQILSAKDYDLLPLVWNISTGDNYGRGLVEDYAATFHELDVTTDAATDMMALICDIKFLVKPGSALAMQVRELNAAKRGSYFAGNKDDVTVPELTKRGDLEVIMASIEKWENDLKEGFLMSNVRNAERVTAEEIRLIAGELESAYGGLYSQLALSWQQKEADYAIAQIDFDAEIGGKAELFEVLVTTGLESLSREGQIDNLRLALSDLTLTQAIPDELRAAINPMRFASFIFTNRSVDLTQFLNTPEEMQAQREQALAEAGRLEEAKAAGKVSEHAGKAAVDNQQS